MWRKCDLHRHTIPDDGVDFRFNPAEFLHECEGEGLSVVAVTDHDRTDHIDAVVQRAPQYGLVVIPGVEITTDRGHILALSPEPDGRVILDELRNRVSIVHGRTSFTRLVDALGEQRVNGSDLFRSHVVLIGAHVDKPGSILGPNQTVSVGDQISCAQELQGLEVWKLEKLQEWRLGIKQTDLIMPLLRGSDAHPTVKHEVSSMWMYLPEVTTESLRHALATHEASISYGQDPPPEPGFWIRSISFEGGLYDGRRIDFSPRANALIGPPASGKSLVIDSIRHVFDIGCEISEVQASIEDRLTSCLPDGTTIVVETESQVGSHEIRRVRGGTSVPLMDAKPIVFSQTELSRRSMERTPSVDLLDVHCPDVARLTRELEGIAKNARAEFQDIVDLATQARAQRLGIENAQDGLEATRARYLSLVGDENTARSLGDLGRIENWHSEAGSRLSEWAQSFLVPDGPELPGTPVLESDLAVGDYVPAGAVSRALDRYRRGVRTIADNLEKTLHLELEKHSPAVQALRDKVGTGLGVEQGVTPEVTAEVERQRTRLSELEQEAQELFELDEQVADQLRSMGDLIDSASECWMNIRRTRKVTCRALNRSMPSFFVRLAPDESTERMDELLNDLKIGTRLHDASVQAVRDALDRRAFVRMAIEHVQYLNPVDDSEDLPDTTAAARKIACEGMDRSKYEAIASLAVLWPSDGIEIFQKPADDAPVAFNTLSEGLKALAIKEVSFAASQVPAVTDQPEDAVPTTVVFENLVPTVREQRISRQFIVASHDANVVVSGDVERVIVLPPVPTELPCVGTLFDERIREKAIALLEGGHRAFELRSRRYGDFA